jgi:high affinity Mn2+ porin
MKCKSLLLAAIVFQVALLKAQDSSSLKEKKLSLHAQTTVISQYHFNFSAPYSGDNSFQTSEPMATSFTATGYAAYKPFKHSYIIFNPEMAGGKGLSKTLGIAGFPNGEVYRVGDPKPQIFIARLYAEQRFALSNKKEKVDDDFNQIQETNNKEYISVLAGKFSLADFFDNSEISHDPRTQFMNWSLMGNGAWDYAANTRGYTLGVVVQALYHDFAFRLAETAMPIEANGPELEYKGLDAGSTVFEIEKTHLLKKDDNHFTTLHAGFYINKARMGNYQTSIQTGLQNFMPPDIEDSRQYGRSKYGFYMSFDNHFGKVHNFIKASWNDGKNETWAFTEIDRSIATGFLLEGSLWKRKNDNLGIAMVVNGLSNDHKQYLSLGGYGFIIGDGKLNYATEQTIELYYSLNVWKKIFITPDYQFVNHPAYNKDRGPVHLVALRLHVEL